MSLVSTLLAGCASVGATAATPTAAPLTATATANPTVADQQTSTAVAFGTADAQRLTAMLTPAAATATPSPAPTDTPLPVRAADSPTPGPIPSSTPVPSLTAAPPAVTVARSATPGGYSADFAKWPARTPQGTDPVRAGFDPATGEYAIALTDATHAYTHWEYAPESRAFGDFTLDLDARQIGGPPQGSYGVLFRAQPQGPEDQTNPHYYLGIVPSSQEVFLIWTGADNKGHVLARKTVPAIRQGDGRNHLQVTARGDKLTVAINGVVAGTATGPATAPGAVGLIVVNPQHPAGSSGEAAAFSNLVVTPAE